VDVRVDQSGVAVADNQFAGIAGFYGSQRRSRGAYDFV